MIWKRFSKDTALLVQGVTGKEGARMTRWLVQSGARVVAGVTPGKAGQEVEGVPVYHTVQDALVPHPDIAITAIVVPGSRVLGAVEEAWNAGIRVMYILTEQVPVHDVRKIREITGDQVAMLGPSSVGYLEMPAFRVGYIGGERPFDLLQEGSLGIISTSGGMTNELMMACTRQRIGIRLALAVGGDRLPLLSVEQAVDWMASQPDVDRILLFIEPGRAFLRELTSGTYVFAKKTIVFLAGDALDVLPKGVPYGHTGTLLQDGDETVAGTRRALAARGIVCVASVQEAMNALK